jgi:hypothetical protein
MHDGRRAGDAGDELSAGAALIVLRDVGEAEAGGARGQLRLQPGLFGHQVGGQAGPAQ